MPSLDPRIDAYIERSADFAKPLLTHIRNIVHKACPEIEETMKWSFPNFVYKGIVCNMAAFKEHCSFGFWKQSLLESAVFPAEKEAMGSFGKLTSVKDLPDEKVLVSLIKKAVELNEKGVKVEKKVAAKKELEIPEYLIAALKKDKAASKTFESFPYSCKKEYVMWITEAKTEPTREKRIAQTVEWLAEGKRRNWKYENC